MCVILSAGVHHVYSKIRVVCDCSLVDSSNILMYLCIMYRISEYYEVYVSYFHLSYDIRFNIQ